jgi:hypothetical protein
VAQVLWAVLAPLLGCLLIYRFTSLRDVRPRWAAALLILGAGAGAGIGGAAILFFALRGIAMYVELAVLAWACFELYRSRGRDVAPAEPSKAAPGVMLLPLAVAAVVALMIATGVMNLVWDANPEGNWDAWSIWNLRARFLASAGGLASRAFSPALSGHPEYPLLTSGFIARCWSYAGADLSQLSPAAPMAMGYLFFLALLSMAAGGLAALRSRTLGVLFALTILGSPLILAEVAVQYADVPLAFYFLAAAMFWLLDQPVLAGVFASLAAWTKDEGLFFLAVFAVCVVAMGRSRADRPRMVRWAMGAAPVAALALFFKLVLARGSDSLLASSSHGLGSKITAMGRYSQIAAAFATGFWNLHLDWYHPLLPLIALVVVLRLDGQWRRSAAFPGALLVTMLAGYFGIFVITSADLTWHLSTALNRLIVQVWPLLILTVLVSLRTPESTVVVTAPAKARKKK